MHVKAVKCRECGNEFVYSGPPRWFYVCTKCNAKRVRRLRDDHNCMRHAVDVRCDDADKERQ